MAQKLIRGNKSDLVWSVPLAGKPTDGSTAGNVTSDWCHVTDRNLSFQLLWTGTTSGTLAFDLSNDGTNVAVTLSKSDFSPALTDPAGSASGTAGQLETAFAYFRVRYTSTSGTGKITGAVAMKI